MFQSLQLFLLLLLHVEYMSVSACALNSEHVLFMSDCPHVCVCMHNAASQSDRQFFKESIQAVERQRTHPDFEKRDAVLVEVRKDDQHTHSPLP